MKDEQQPTSPIVMHIHVDGEALARVMAERPVDIREMLKKQQEREQNRRILLDIAYRNCKE